MLACLNCTKPGIGLLIGKTILTSIDDAPEFVCYAKVGPTDLMAKSGRCPKRYPNDTRKSARMLRSKAIDSPSPCSCLLFLEGLHGVLRRPDLWFIATGRFWDIDSGKVAAKIATEATGLAARR